MIAIIESSSSIVSVTKKLGKKLMPKWVFKLIIVAVAKIIPAIKIP